MDLLFRHFWIAFLVAGAINARAQWERIERRIRAHPELEPGYRRLLGRAFHVLASAWVVGPVADTQCGFKGFTRAAARDLFGRQQITSIVFDAELIYLARRRGYRMAVVPIRWADRRGSRMRPGIGLAARVAWDLLRIPVLHRRVPRAAMAPAPPDGT